MSTPQLFTEKLFEPLPCNNNQNMKARSTYENVYDCH